MAGVAISQEIPTRLGALAADEIRARGHPMPQLLARPRRGLMPRGTIGEPDTALARGRVVPGRNLRLVGGRWSSWTVMLLADHDRASGQEESEEESGTEEANGPWMRPPPF